MKTMSDEDARNLCLSVRGLGPWAADYILIRGLGRPDVLPADDDRLTCPAARRGEPGVGGAEGA
jgi:AraC family transcriptional regulator of adaptative response / DNA-3-methyladenine glycosylase II